LPARLLVGRFPGSAMGAGRKDAGKQGVRREVRVLSRAPKGQWANLPSAGRPPVEHHERFITDSHADSPQLSPDGAFIGGSSKFTSNIVTKNQLLRRHFDSNPSSQLNQQLTLLPASSSFALFLFRLQYRCSSAQGCDERFGRKQNSGSTLTTPEFFGADAVSSPEPVDTLRTLHLRRTCRQPANDCIPTEMSTTDRSPPGAGASSRIQRDGATGPGASA
jgi:hypothetical protein